MNDPASARLDALHIEAWKADQRANEARNMIARRKREIAELEADLARLDREAAAAHVKLDAARI